MNRLTHLARLATMAWFVVLTGCASYEVRTTHWEPPEAIEVDTPDEYLLDVGVQVFEPDYEHVPDEGVVFSQVREAESVFIAQNLKTTLETSNAWGAVRVVPDKEVLMDLSLAGKIVESNGETLTLDVKVTDLTGRVWLEQQYTQTVSKFAYDSTQSTREPFQGVYNNISNDLLALLKSTPLSERESIRAVSAMRFAQSFSPDAFSQYLSQNEDGQYSLSRLPPENDPLFNQVKNIQARDQLFVDVLQDYYFGFADNMNDPYREWRSQSYQETQIIRELQGAARTQKLVGWLAIIGGAAAGVASDSNAGRVAGAVAVAGGLQQLRQSYTKRDEATLHIETLSELGLSLEQQLEPSVIELQDRTVTLTGNVRTQYDEWRRLLADLYYAETGYERPADPIDANNGTDTDLN